MSKIKGYWMDLGEPEQWEYDDARKTAEADFRNHGFWLQHRFEHSDELRRVYDGHMASLMQAAIKADTQTETDTGTRT